MYGYNRRKTSLIFGICLMLGILMFGAFGATFAYFQINNYIEQTYTLGTVGAYWCQGTNDTVISANEEVELNSGASLVRGDEAGVEISGGMIAIKATAESQTEYVRIKYAAYVDDVEVAEITNNLKLREKSGNTFVALGENSSLWISGGDGWYYYSGGPIDLYSGAIPVCNNIMLVELDEVYLNKQLKIKMEFETLQSDNNPVEAVWGAGAKTALGVA